MSRILIALVVVGFWALAGPAHSATIYVSSQAGLERAVDRIGTSTGTIIVRRGFYPRLAIVDRYGSWLTVRGAPGAQARTLTLESVAHVRLRDLRVVGTSFAGGRLHVRYARGVTVENVRLYKSRAILKDADNVTFRRAEFTQCGNLREDVCLSMGWNQWRANHLLVTGSWFHDCYGCDFIRGHVGVGFILRNSTLERAVPGPCGEFWHCNHQDGVQMNGGRRILIERNRFGLTYRGAGQLYFSKAMSGITIRNNVFLGIDRALPDYVGWAAIVIGNHRVEEDPYGFPRDVRIVNNTVLTGSPRPDGLANSVYLTPSYATIPVSERPLVANNVLGLLRNPERLCTLGGVVVANIVKDGGACMEGGLVGDPMLTELGEPLEGSPVIDAGDPAWATPTDFYGFGRGAFPDIGAYEYGAN